MLIRIVAFVALLQCQGMTGVKASCAFPVVISAVSGEAFLFAEGVPVSHLADYVDAFIALKNILRTGG